MQVALARAAALALVVMVPGSPRRRRRRRRRPGGRLGGAPRSAADGAYTATAVYHRQ